MLVRDARVCDWQAQGNARKSLKRGPEAGQGDDPGKGGRGRGRGRGRGKGKGRGRGKTAPDPKNDCDEDRDQSVNRNLNDEFDAVADSRESSPEPVTPALPKNPPLSRKRTGDKIENPGKTRQKRDHGHDEEKPEPNKKRKRSGGAQTTERAAQVARPLEEGLQRFASANEAWNLINKNAYGYWTWAIYS